MIVNIKPFKRRWNFLNRMLSAVPRLYLDEEAILRKVSMTHKTGNMLTKLRASSTSKYISILYTIYAFHLISTIT